MKKRVVITGMGAITSLGFDINTVWQSIKTGKSGISLIERIDVSDLPTKVAAEIKDFNPIDFIEKKEVKRLDRFSQYAMAAAQMAVESSQLDPKILQNGRTGIILGSGIGGLETLENQYHTLLEKGTNRVSPFLIPMMLSNMAAGTLAIKFGIKGFVECVVSACATSTNAIGDAFKIIQRDAADVMLTGGAEAAITRLAMAGFCASKAMTTNDNIDKACRPFDLERNGFVMGEGAGVLVVEELNHALNRGADIIAEIVGYGCTNDAYHITAVDPKGDSAAACMKLALEDAGLTAEDIQYINAHGTSTELNDRMETTAIKSAFGEHADKIAVSSTKSMTGHLLGAAGAVEAIITSMALKEGFLPPTIHYENFDPACDLDYVPNQGRQSKVIHALSNSFGFGGHNATLALKAYK
ncbi:beta-ketoacyl-ACP synthase II [Anaerosinus massiliensis]|uniref:beta-ketoacyl-ACP synthase II n=1 Tax=Massilibacillus massiliensis TaxID=1806837 RepID=UPI000AFB3ACF|nr:beta-ketoacyl-ACP synthase II [Massilibacillus massiliensis]